MSYVGKKYIKEPDMQTTKLVPHELKDQTFTKNVTRTAHC